MEIIYQGQHNANDTAKGLAEVLLLLNQRYNIANFREIYLSVTLVNAKGEDVELIDSDTNQIFRYFELHESTKQLKSKIKNNTATLKLVIDNTKNTR